MLSIRKTIDGKMTALEEVQEGCWVNLTSPTEAELALVAKALNVEMSFLQAAMDEEEPSRIDTEEGQTLVVVDLPAPCRFGDGRCRGLCSAGMWATTAWWWIMAVVRIVSRRRPDFFVVGPLVSGL